MFDLSFEKIAVLIVIALFVLGPERLPAAAEWLGRTIRQLKGYAAAANQQIQAEIGPELDQLRQPLADLRAPLQELRSLQDPRTAVMRHFMADPPGSTDGVPMSRTTSPPPIDHDAT